MKLESRLDERSIGIIFPMVIFLYGTIAFAGIELVGVVNLTASPHQLKSKSIEAAGHFKAPVA